MSEQDPSDETSSGMPEIVPLSIEDTSISSTQSTGVYQGKVVKFITNQLFNVNIVKNDVFNLIDEIEEGAVKGFEIAVNSSKVIFEVVLFGDDLTRPYIINNYTMQKLLQLGRGLTPGEVVLLPTQQSQDIRGQRDDEFPWLSRYKDDDTSDHLGSTDRIMVLRYSPGIYEPYQRIVVNIRNTDSSNTISVTDLTFSRIVYIKREDPFAGPPKVSHRGPFSNVNVELDDKQQLDRKRKKLSNMQYTFSLPPPKIPDDMEE